MSEKVESFIQKALSEEDKATDFGYHFISGFLENPRHWYLKNYLGISPTKKGKGLIFGLCMHRAVECFRTVEQSEDALVQTFLAIHQSYEDSYFDPEDFAIDEAKGPLMLRAWANKWADHDTRNYELIDAEVEREFVLSNGFTMTIKIDAAYRIRSNDYYFLTDLKTTGYSAGQMWKKVNELDQVSTYCLGFKKLFPNRVLMGFMPDILSCKTSKLKSGVSFGGVYAERQAYIDRTPYQLFTWEASLIGLFERLYTSIKAVQNGAPFEGVFPRNGKDTSEYPDNNDYKLLDQNPPDAKFLPEGYVINFEKAQEHIGRFMLKWEACEQPNWLLKESKN